MATNSYVKFERGTLTAFQRIPVKNPDTLYFITDLDDSVFLYLGDKLIGGGNTTINNITLDALKDVIIDEPKNKQVLMYCEDTEKWMNVNPSKLFGNVAGATSALDGASGLVPAPKAGDQDKFLRGDGTWATVDSLGGDISADDVTGLNEAVQELTKPIEDKVSALDALLNGTEASGATPAKSGLIDAIGDVENLPDYPKDSENDPASIVNAITYIYQLLTWGEF